MYWQHFDWRSLDWPSIGSFAATALGALALLWGAWWVWWRLPKRQVHRLRLSIRDPKARADVEDNIRKTVGQLIGGAAVLVGAGFAYLQFTQQQRASHDLLISNQVSKGFEQLGSNKRVVRVGGIYALEGVMNTSEQYYLPVLEALNAFVRDSTRTYQGNGPPATDIQAALTVIGRRAGGKGFPDLDDVHIPQASLFGANLINAHLINADLYGARLLFANLNGAFLNSADLRGAFLNNANLTEAFLYDADLRGANLTGANLTGAKLNDKLRGSANLTGADLNNAFLRGATITQEQLNEACGTDAKLDPGLTLKPCSNSPPTK